jgi:hypothetical protein
MGEVIFARPRHNYDSYTDLYRLIELAGYPLIFADEIQPDSDNCYIVTIYNGETQGGWAGAKARIVLYDLEWHMDGLPAIPGVAEIWSPDKWVADKLGWRYVPLGSDARLNPEPDINYSDCPKHYDVALLSYMGPPRRQQVAHGLQQRGVSFAPNGWGLERHAALQASRVMAHIHQLEGVYAVAAQRFCLAAAYHLPLVTETLAGPGIFAGKVLMTDAAHYPEFTAMWLAGDGNRLADLGRELHYLLCVEHTFRKCVEAAL